MRTKVTDEVFVREYCFAIQHGEPIESLANRLGITGAGVYIKAQRLIRRGVKLPKWENVSVERLNEIVSEVTG